MNAGGNPSPSFWTYTVGGVTTNTYYLSFTEDTNLTTTPIKLAPTPFLPVTTPSILFTDSFDAYPALTYPQGTFFGTWTVLTNQVDIVTAPTAPIRLPNALQLDDGAVVVTLPTVAGQKYQLSYEQGTSETDTGADAHERGLGAGDLYFTASSASETLTLEATGDPVYEATLTNGIVKSFGTAALIDDVQLATVPGDLYYQPEQSLLPIIGMSRRRRVIGRWKCWIIGRGLWTQFTAGTGELADAVRVCEHEFHDSADHIDQRGVFDEHGAGRAASFGTR